MLSNNREIILDSKSFLVSETDERGIIRFANDEFCKYSGYELSELIGKPHNMVRHNDMPSAAFKDLWATVKSGKRWSGFVKNATKDNDYYWVYATVYPFISHDNSKGYISCRKIISREEAEQYTLRYKQMKQKER